MTTAVAEYPFHILCKPIGPVCNLKCAYCFYLEKKDLYPRAEKWRMSTEVLERFVQQYIEAQPAGTQEVNFAWQGGEPTLMGIDFFRQALAFQKQYARPGMTISNALQTNGTLLNDEWGEFLHDNGFLIGISIDGSQQIHDRFRLDRVGAGTWQRVMDGLDVLQRHKVEYNALILVNRFNGAHPVEIYDFIRGRGVEFMQFIPLVEFEDRDAGTLTDRSLEPKQWGNFLNRIFDRWRQRDIGKIYVQHFDMMLGIVMGQPGTLCVHSEVCGRNVAMEHNGDVYACDHFVFPDYHLGNLMETQVSALLDSEQQVQFGLNKRDGLTTACKKCKYLQFCWGGCPNHRCGKAPDGEEGHNTLCEGYMMFYRHTLPYLQAMGQCLRAGRPARDYRLAMRPQQPAMTRRPPGPPGRNDPCPCGSGKKFKKCHGR